jgi:molybdopterin-biosynthesis enzyme MoeA-like protein
MIKKVKAALIIIGDEILSGRTHDANLNYIAKWLANLGIGKQNLSDARLRMAMIPEGARLIKNPISGAPGFQIENVIVLAGIPVVMQSMLLDIENRLSRGSKITSEALHVFTGESHFAKILEEIEQSFDYLSIGSYPFNKSGSYGASFVLRSQICSEVTEAKIMLIKKIEETGTQWFSGEAPKF